MLEALALLQLQGWEQVRLEQALVREKVCAHATKLVMTGQSLALATAPGLTLERQMRLKTCHQPNHSWAWQDWELVLGLELGLGLGLGLAAEHQQVYACAPQAPAASLAASHQVRAPRNGRHQGSAGVEIVVQQ